MTALDDLVYAEISDMEFAESTGEKIDALMKENLYSARAELASLRARLETAEGGLKYIQKWVRQDQSPLSKEQICRAVSGMCADALMLNHEEDEVKFLSATKEGEK